MVVEELNGAIRCMESNTDLLMDVPVTSRSTKFNSYVELVHYKNVYGRANAAQMYSYSAKRAKSKSFGSFTG